MGIVNITPDSFSDGGLYASTDDAVLHAVRLIEEGADILDIGGESTRPGSAPVGVEEELRRVLPVVQALENKGIPISVDTSKPEVMRATIKAGATMINDINALQSPGALEVVADRECSSMPNAYARKTKIYAVRSSIQGCDNRNKRFFTATYRGSESCRNSARENSNRPWIWVW